MSRFTFSITHRRQDIIECSCKKPGLSVTGGEIIEDYSGGEPLPGSLILGYTNVNIDPFI